MGDFEWSFSCVCFGFVVLLPFVCIRGPFLTLVEDSQVEV